MMNMLFQLKAVFRACTLQTKTEKKPSTNGKCLFMSSGVKSFDERHCLCTTENQIRVV